MGRALINAAISLRGAGLMALRTPAENESDPILANNLKNARAGRPRSKKEEAAGCSVALSAHEKMLETEPNNASAKAMIEQDRACIQAHQAGVPAKSKAVAPNWTPADGARDKAECEGISREGAPAFVNICVALGRKAALEAQRKYDMDPKHRGRVCGRVLVRQEITHAVKWETKCFWLIQEEIRG